MCLCDKSYSCTQWHALFVYAGARGRNAVAGEREGYCKAFGKWSSTTHHRTGPWSILASLSILLPLSMPNPETYLLLFKQMIIWCFDTSCIHAIVALFMNSPTDPFKFLSCFDVLMLWCYLTSDIYTQTRTFSRPHLHSLFHSHTHTHARTHTHTLCCYLFLFLSFSLTRKSTAR